MSVTLRRDKEGTREFDATDRLRRAGRGTFVGAYTVAAKRTSSNVVP